MLPATAMNRFFGALRAAALASTSAMFSIILRAP
jgi:hypothetical protein